MRVRFLRWLRRLKNFRLAAFVVAYWALVLYSRYSMPAPGSLSRSDVSTSDRETRPSSGSTTGRTC